jgi:hypothetical protein
MQLANEGQTLEKPRDMLKNPLVLEFLGMEEKSAYTENELESAIIDKLQKFLLELGKGFLFEARQKRFSFDEEHFFVDLVFYNRLLQCYVVIDLKTEKLTHQDLGQVQMYVNYFDRYVKQAFEKPTVGILLCKEKDSGPYVLMNKFRPLISVPLGKRINTLDPLPRKERQRRATDFA